MRPRIVLAAVVAVIMVAAPALVSTALAGNLPRDEPSTAADPQVQQVPEYPAGPMLPPPQLDPAPLVSPTTEVDVDIEGFLSWAVHDRTNGEVLTSDNAAETSSTESMIKVWIVADYLRRLAEDDDDPSDRDLRDARRAIRDSHNGTAERLYAAGGHDDVVDRMVDICELTDTHTPDGDEGWWSRTETSARDAMRLGDCLVDGRAAGPEWTDWLLDQMRQVRGTTADRDQRPDDGFEGGRWGIVDGLPEQVVDEGVAIKNGWTRIGRTNSWHLNCLAVTDDWVMAVLMRYPAEYSLDYGAERCASVARQLVGDQLAADAATGVV